MSCDLVERLHSRLCDLHNAIVLIGREFHKEVVDRIDAHTVVAYLVVKVRGERKTRIATQCDDVAATDRRAALDIYLAQVAVRRGVAVAVIDNERLTRSRVAQSHLTHATIGRGEDSRALGNGIINTLM